MEKYTEKQQKALTAWDWVKILKGNPELANKYDRLNLIHGLGVIFFRNIRN